MRQGVISRQPLRAGFDLIESDCCSGFLVFRDALGRIDIQMMMSRKWWFFVTRRAAYFQ